MPATDKIWRDLNKMHLTFALSSVALLAVTIWMLAADHNDPWREHQKTFFNVEAERLRQAKFALESPEFVEQKKKLDDERDKFKNASNEVKATEKQVAQLAHEYDVSLREVKNERAKRDVARANLDIGVRDNVSADEMARLEKGFAEQQEKVDGLENANRNKLVSLNQAQQKLNALTADKRQVDADISKLTADFDRTTKALEVIVPDNGLAYYKRKIMEWPIIDGFNSHIKIQQDWMPKLHQTLGMTSSARFDRCRTCHQAMDRVQAAPGGGIEAAFPLGHGHDLAHGSVKDWVNSNKYPHPYATHPNPELFLTSSSPHPVATFGCTVCHEGQGSGTEFSNAAHYPNNPVQHHDWEKEHGFKTNHYWEYPMYPKRFMESACLKCHHQVVELDNNPKFGPTAPKLVKGYNLIKKYGCFGCHEINGYDGSDSIGPDLRLEPNTEEERQKYAADPGLVAGSMRKVGPSLRHVASKTTPAFLSYWTEEPKRFRANTKMPQFYKLSNQHDKIAEDFQPVELAGISSYLTQKSQNMDLLSPADGYEANAERGQQLFAERGCLACHSHNEFPAAKEEFGPNLNRVFAKIRPGKEGFNWLYTWIREPTRHHKRTKMPVLYLDAYEDKGTAIDPAADIAAFLLQKNEDDKELDFSHDQNLNVSDSDLDELVKMFLNKVLANQAEIDKVIDEKKFPLPADQIKGDEIELLPPEGTETVSDELWREMKLNYVGRRTISRYGCYGCHDIPGYENARPIGTALQDWGRKETSKLAPEHIHHYLEHHGEPDGSSTSERVEKMAGALERGEFTNDEERERASSVTFFYEDLLHHGRAGFFWQKVRDPRSYDYKKVETKGYDERLRMPKFPFNEEEVEAIATFVLGLVAEPPVPEYVYSPTATDLARIEGDQLIQKFNCTGCHSLDLPEIRVGNDLEELASSELGAADHPEALGLLEHMKPTEVLNPEHLPTKEFGEGEDKVTLPIVNFHGAVVSMPDREEDFEDWEYTFELWRSLKIGETHMLPQTRISVPAAQLFDSNNNVLDVASKSDKFPGYAKPARGGHFAEWLTEYLIDSKGMPRGEAMQASPPTLYKEGHKVQTPWLYQFLLEPEKLRHLTVLRMPKFNMSSAEAQTLANYFAAVDNVPFPYQDIPQREPEYLAQKNQELKDILANSDENYLGESWNVLNASLCIGCHAVGGRPLNNPDPTKVKQGPNLELAGDRLRPDYLMLWLYKPSWILPYTSMPSPPLPKNGSPFPKLFAGDSKLQTIGARDALLNHAHLMTTLGKVAYEPPKPDADKPAAAGSEEEE